MNADSRPLTEVTGLSLSELAAIERFLVGCTVPVVYQGAERTGVLGTGAFFSFEGRIFLVTAGHLFRGADPKRMAIPGRPSNNVALWSFGHATIHHPRDTDEYDVAVIEPHETEFLERVRAGWTVLECPNPTATESQAENYLIAGYPDTTVKYEDSVLTPTALMQLYTGVYEGEVFDSRGEFDLFLRYGESAGNTYGYRKDTPHLGGASGALVFALGPRPSGVWSPSAILTVVGIQVAFFHSKYVRAKKWALVEHVLSIVSSKSRS